MAGWLIPYDPVTGWDEVAVARAFHETYERLAPKHGYETRPESAVPWEQVPANNRRLMVDVADTVLARLAYPRDEAHIAELEAALAARSHEAIDARARVEVAVGLLRRLDDAGVIAICGDVITDVDDVARVRLDPAEAALFDSPTEEPPSGR